MNKTEDWETEDGREDLRAAHMETLFGWICREPDVECAVAALEDYALRDLHAWLLARNAEHGVAGLILGLVICEACDRFMGGKTEDFEAGGDA